MENKIKKIVIITRTDGYINTSTNKEMPGREKFAKPIIEQIFNKTDIAEPKINNLGWAVKEYLFFKDYTYKDYKDNKYRDDNDWGTYFNDKYKILPDTDKPKEDGFEQIFSKFDKIVRLNENENSEDGLTELLIAWEAYFPKVKNEKCYVEVKVEDNDKKTEYEIYLFLWDCLSRETDELCDPFNLFIKQVCIDCNITPKKDNSEDTINMLYAHDFQLTGNQTDETIINRFDTNFKSKYNNESYFKTLNDYFDYVATFGHMSIGGTFQNYILKLKFGPTDADKIAQKEAEAKCFRPLRDEAVKIIK